MPTYTIEGRSTVEGPQDRPVQIYRDISKQDIDQIVLEGCYEDDLYYWVSEVTEQDDEIHTWDKLLYIKEPQGEFIPVEDCEVCNSPATVSELRPMEVMDITQVVCDSCYSKFKEDWN